MISRAFLVSTCDDANPMSDPHIFKSLVFCLLLLAITVAGQVLIIVAGQVKLEEHISYLPNLTGFILTPYRIRGRAVMKDLSMNFLPVICYQ